MRDAYEAFEARGVRVVVIGNGRPEHAKQFRADEGIPFALWVDPELRAYEAAGLGRGITKTLSHRSFGHTWRAMRGGFRQTKVQGDAWQLGGVFLITPAGELLFEQRSREAGDHTDLGQVLTAIDAALAGEAKETWK